MQRHRPPDLEIRRAPGATFRAEQSETDFRPIVRGYPILFDSLSEDLGGWRERIMPGAFDRTLHEKIDVRALINHDTTKPVGRISAGTLRLKVDRQGVFSEIDLPNTSAARDLVESMRRGDVTGGSFAFRTIGYDWKQEDGTMVRLVQDMRVSEVSIGVTFPAYEETDLAVAKRSLEAFLRSRGVSVAELRARSEAKVAAWAGGRR